MISAQSCTVNAGGNATICGTTYTLQGSAGSNTVGNPTWTLVSKPSGAPDPVISNVNSFTPNITGMTSPGSYVFRITQPCTSGPAATSQVTITAPGATTGFTAGPDITGISAITGVATLNATIPAGYTASWRYYNIYYKERYKEEITDNATMANSNTASPTLTLTKKADHNIDPAYRVILRITSINNPSCWYEDDAIVRFVPNPQIILPTTYSFCSSNSQRYMYFSNGSPYIDASEPNSAGNSSFGTTVTLNVISQPAGGNMTYKYLQNESLDFNGVDIAGAYVFTLTVSNANGSYTTPQITFNYLGKNVTDVSFIDAAHPEQMQSYREGGSGGAVYCNKAGDTSPITIYYTLNSSDSPSLAANAEVGGTIPPGGSPTLVLNGAGTRNRSVTVTPPSGGWRVGTYNIIIYTGSGTCSTYQNYYIHISDGNRPDVKVSNTTVCYPGSGTVTATIPLPAVYKGVVNSSYFQNFDGRYDFTLVSKPTGAANPTYETNNLRTFTNTSTVISNLDKPGEYVFKITAVIDAGGVDPGFISKEYACSGTSMEGTFSVFVSEQVGANAGSDQSISCVTTATLNGNNPGTQGSTGLWTLASKPSGAPDPVITNPTQYNSGVTNLVNSGTYTFNWTITTGNCVSTTQSSINVTAVPSSVTVTPATQTVAYNAIPTNLTGSATGATSYQWYSNTTNSNTGGTLIPGTTSTTYTPPTNVAGTQYYYIIAGNAAGCSAPSAAAQVTITPCAAVPTAPTVNIAIANNCPATTVNLNSQAHTGAIPVNSTLVWFTDAMHTTAVPIPTAVGGGTYYAFYYNTVGNCYSPASNPVTVTINACSPCTASASTQTVNLNSITVAAAPAGSVLQWHNSATPSASTLLSSTTVNATATPTNYWAYYYDSTNNCYSPGSKATVVSNSCCNYPTVNLTALPQSTTPSGAQLVWYTTSTRTAGTQVTNPLAVANGTYWPFFYDAANNCYSPVGSPVMVAIDSVCPVADYGYIYINKKALDENSSVDFNFTVNGGPVTAFTLNDKETKIDLSDLGSSESGRLWAVASNRSLYYRNAGSSDWVQTAITTATKVDGAAGSDCYFTNTAGQVLRYDGVTAPTVIGSPADYGTLNAMDVGSAWNTTPYIMASNNTIWIYSGSGTAWSQVGTTTNNLKGVDADPSTGDAIVTDGTLVYRLTSAGVKTSLGAPPGWVDDIAVTSAGEVFSTSQVGYVRKWVSGTTWSAPETTSRLLAGRLTAGNKEQVWSTNPVYPMLRSIYTRMIAGTTATWLDDERVRTTNKGNTIMIKVPVGTYTVKEAAISGWELQSIDVYDPTSNSTSNFADKSVTLNVALNETVYAVFTNGLVNPFAMGNDCSTVFFEDFGSDAAGTVGPPLTGQTSYHYAAGNNFAQDGYYKIATNAGQFWGGSNAAPYDHTSGDGTGRMMTINASYDKGIFFRRKFTNLVPGKSYRFSAWLMSLSNDVVKPNATFQVVDPVSGAVLNQVASGNITTHNVWNEYSMNFVPTSTELDLILLNNAPGGNGNDIALDDIRFEMNRPQNLTVSRDCSASKLTVTGPLGAIYEYSLDNVNWQASPSFSGVTASVNNFYVRYADAPACVSSAAVPSCYCYKPGATTGGATLDTKVGISSLGRAGLEQGDNWPMVHKGGHIALESKTKGFVPNRVAFDASGNPVGIPTANFVEGMMVYDTTNKCMKIYTLKEKDTTMAWHCITTQTCPD